MFKIHQNTHNAFSKSLVCQTKTLKNKCTRNKSRECKTICTPNPSRGSPGARSPQKLQYKLLISSASSLHGIHRRDSVLNKYLSIHSCKMCMIAKTLGWLNLHLWSSRSLNSKTTLLATTYWETWFWMRSLWATQGMQGATTEQFSRRTQMVFLRWCTTNKMLIKMTSNQMRKPNLLFNRHPISNHHRVPKKKLKNAKLRVQTIARVEPKIFQTSTFLKTQCSLLNKLYQNREY